MSAWRNLSVAVRIAAVGFVVWIGLILGFGRTLGPISSLLLLAPLVVVPLGLGATQPRSLWVCAGSLPVVCALIIRASHDSRHAYAVGLAAVWAVLTCVLAIRAVVQWLTRPTQNRFSATYLLQVAALVELATAAVWLVAACLRIELLGFSQSIVLLTAVHFHFAGFGACTVALIRRKRAPSPDQQGWATAFALFVLGASPVVAIGHLTFGALELLGGILLTIGIWGIAALGWKQSRNTYGITRWLMLIGAVAPVVPMLLAIQYGLTRVSDLEQISFNTIALIHGGLNALGFLSANLLAENLSEKFVPGTGVEPVRPGKGQRGLSPPRLPFRHPG